MHLPSLAQPKEREHEEELWRKFLFSTFSFLCLQWSCKLFLLTRAPDFSLFLFCFSFLPLPKSKWIGTFLRFCCKVYPEREREREEKGKGEKVKGRKQTFLPPACSPVRWRWQTSSFLPSFPACLSDFCPPCGEREKREGGAEHATRQLGRLEEEECGYRQEGERELESSIWGLSTMETLFRRRNCRGKNRQERRGRGRVGQKGDGKRTLSLSLPIPPDRIRDLGGRKRGKDGWQPLSPSSSSL